MTDPQTCPAPACNQPKRPHQYLCGGCWATLPRTTRTALRRTDAAAFRRLSDLREQLRSGVPLHRIEITP